MRRAARLLELKTQVEVLPDCLDARGVRLVDLQSATSEWLGHQFEVFDESFKRILQGRVVVNGHYCRTSTQPSARMHVR